MGAAKDLVYCSRAHLILTVTKAFLNFSQKAHLKTCLGQLAVQRHIDVETDMPH